LKILRDIQQLEIIQKAIQNSSLAFVPTMGALHDGHLDLVKKAKQCADYVIVSIFVNPLQFNNQEDLQKYPRNIENDCRLLESVNCDFLYLPSQEEVYPESFAPVLLDLGGVENELEGEFRPGHFDGVVQVLYRLFSIVQPKIALFGLKDFQQCIVVNKLKEAFFPNLEILLVPTVRDKDGLALSSRNERLSKEGRESATHIFKALNMAKENFPHFNPTEIENLVKDYLLANNFQVDYVSIVEVNSFQKTNVWELDRNYLILTAVFLEGVRLIDNLLLNN
jgi:pantoate--beta-alanine ligase